MKTIKVLFDATILVYGEKNPSDRTGIYWVAFNILQQFLLNKSYKITLYSSNQKFKKLSFKLPFVVFNDRQRIYKLNIEVHKNQIKKTKNIIIIAFRLLQIIKNLVLLLQISLLYRFDKKYCIDNYDVFISPMFSLPDMIIDKKKIKMFHILYDCVPLMNNVPFLDIDSAHWFIKLVKALNKETYYFCISECTKKDFLKIASSQLDEKKMYVTPSATSKKYFPNYNISFLKEVLKKYNYTFNSDDHYIFSLCTIDPRKNLLFTIKCFIKFLKKNSIENTYFFLGGGKGCFEEYYKTFLFKISDFTENCNKIIYLGYVDDDDINILYSNSLLFVYLSQYEGFGIPPLEAMQAGTPVICSNNSSLPEVVGNAAIMIDYGSEEQCIKAFENLYFYPELRKEYIKKGIERAKLFSWERTFNTMSNVIMETINK